MPRIRLRHPRLVLACATFALVSGASAAYANWPGSITNSTNNAKSGTVAFTINSVNGFGFNCVLAAGKAVPNTDPCPNAIIGKNVTNQITNSNNTGSGSITNNGTLTPSQLTATLSLPTCGVLQYVNTANTNNPMLARGPAQYNVVADPWGTTSDIRLPALAAGGAVVQQNTPSLIGGYSFGVWFKAPLNNGAHIMSQAITPARVSSTGSTYSPVGLFLDKTFHLRFQFASLGGTVTAATPNTYNDGNWHFVVVTVSTLLTLTTMTAYVDDTTANNTATTTSTTLLTSQQGYWHVGFVDTNGVSPANTPSTSTVYLSGAFVRNTPTNTAEFAALKASASAAAYKSAVLGLSQLDSLWMLDDDGMGPTWNGTIPGAGSVLPCDMANFTWTFANPAYSIAVTPTTGTALVGSYTLPTPTPGSTQTWTTSYIKNVNYNAAAAQLILFWRPTYTIRSAPGNTWGGIFRFSPTGTTGTGGSAMQFS